MNMIKQTQTLIAKEDIDLEYPDDVTIPKGTVGRITEIDLRPESRKVMLGVSFDNFETVFFNNDRIFDLFEIETEYECLLNEE